MSEKSIRKIVQLAITREEWDRQTLQGGEQVAYTVRGEVRNIGLSSVKNALVVAGIINTRSKKLYQAVTRDLRLYKAADYSVLPVLEQGETAKFEIAVQLPEFKEIPFGRYVLRRLEDGILEERFKYKTYLIYDQKAMDESTIEWFRDENLQSLKVSGVKWTEMYNESKILTALRCTGRIKNAGTRKVENFYVEGTITDIENNPLIFQFENSEYTISAEEIFDELDQNKIKTFQLDCIIPEDDILLTNNWSRKKILNMLEEKKLSQRLQVNFVEDVDRPSIYRDSEENPTVIEEAEGEKKIEYSDVSWVFDDVNSEYLITGVIRNVGKRPADDIYIIASIVNEEENTPFIWETATDTYKALVIEKVPYLQADNTYDFAMRMKVPGGRLFGKSSKSAEQGLADGNLKQVVELYYMKKDVLEEGEKRLRLGNSYFQLKNFKGCLREYSEGIKLVPDDKMLYFNSALSYYKMGDFDRVLDNCERVISLDKSDPRAFYLMGLVHHTQKNYESALKYYRRSYQNDQENLRVMYNLACVQFALGNFDDGISWLKKADEIDHQVIRSQVNRDTELKAYMKNESVALFVAELRGRA